MDKTLGSSVCDAPFSSRSRFNLADLLIPDNCTSILDLFTVPMQWKRRETIKASATAQFVLTKKPAQIQQNTQTSKALQRFPSEINTISSIGGIVPSQELPIFCVWLQRSSPAINDRLRLQQQFPYGADCYDEE